MLWLKNINFSKLYSKYRLCFHILGIVFIILIGCLIVFCYLKYEQDNKITPSQKHISSVIKDLNLTKKKETLVNIADINGSYAKMVKYEYRTNLLTNINAVGVVIIGATSALNHKFSSIFLSILEGVSILYAKRTSELEKECRDRYLLLNEIVNLDENNSVKFNELKKNIILKSTQCLY
jgi:hypothetical protein